MRIRYILLSVTALLASTAFSQIRISDPGTAEDLSGTVYTVGEEPQTGEHEHPFEVINESDEVLNVGCRRIELDVTPGQGMESTLCWVICPAYVPVGSEPIRTSPFSSQLDPGEVDISFVMHLRTFGYDGCSSYRIEWFNADNDTEVFASIDMVFDHSSGVCATGIEDLDLSSLINMQPNPADDFLRLSMNDINVPLTISIYDILGQEAWTRQSVVGQGQIDIPTTTLHDGIYFVTFADGNRTLYSEKLVISH